jgi:hypothetical protein
MMSDNTDAPEEVSNVVCIVKGCTNPKEDDEELCSSCRDFLVDGTLPDMKENENIITQMIKTLKTAQVDLVSLQGANNALRENMI